MSIRAYSILRLTMEMQNSRSTTIYTVSRTGDNKGQVQLDWTFEEVRRVGEIEGLVVDPNTGELLVHAIRGKDCTRDAKGSLCRIHRRDHRSVCLQGLEIDDED